MDENITALLKQMRTQQQEFLQQHREQQTQHQEEMKLMRELLERNNQPAPAMANGNGESARDVKAKNLADSMESFSYDPDDNAIFESWYKRYETVFTAEVAGWTEPEKVRLLLR